METNGLFSFQIFIQNDFSGFTLFCNILKLVRNDASAYFICCANNLSMSSCRPALAVRTFCLMDALLVMSLSTDTEDSCVCVHMYLYKYQNVWKRAHVCGYASMYVNECMYVCMYLCMYVYMYISMHVCMYVC